MTAKRLLDICVAILLFPIFLGILPLMWIGGKIVGHPTLFFRQERIGIACTRLGVIKFRSLRSEGRGERPSRLFRVVRRVGLDELPQLLLVLKGQMSCVGPRPLLPVDLFQPNALNDSHLQRLIELRQSVKPGMTGISQISNKHRECDSEFFQKMIEDESWYAENHSVGLDLGILVLTGLYALSLGRLRPAARLVLRARVDSVLLTSSDCAPGPGEYLRKGQETTSTR